MNAAIRNMIQERIRNLKIEIGQLEEAEGMYPTSDTGTGSSEGSTEGLTKSGKPRMTKVQIAKRQKAAWKKRKEAKLKAQQGEATPEEAKAFADAGGVPLIPKVVKTKKAIKMPVLNEAELANVDAETAHPGFD